MTDSFETKMISTKVVEVLAHERIEELNGKFEINEDGTVKELFIVEIRVSTTNVIDVFLDSLHGKVSIEDCVSVSRNVEHNLDRESEDFQLQVSSAGMDQPFKVHRQYLKNLGREVRVVFKEHGSIEGKLLEVSDDKIVVETSKKQKIEGKKKKELVIEQHEFSFEEIKETKIVISFK